MSKYADPLGMLTAFRHFWMARNIAVRENLIGDNGGAIHSAERIAEVMSRHLVYPFATHANTYKLHSEAHRSVAAHELRERLLSEEKSVEEIRRSLFVEHVLPKRAMTIEIGKMVDEGMADEQILDWLKSEFRLILLTQEEMAKLNKRNRSMICPQRMEGIPMHTHGLRKVTSANDQLDSPCAAPKRVGGSNAQSDAVALSWDDPEVRAKRLKRWMCYVDGTEYSSVKLAAEALRLFPGRPEAHIKWRGKLVRDAELGGSGLADNLGRHWTVKRIK